MAAVLFGSRAKIWTSNLSFKFPSDAANTTAYHQTQAYTISLTHTASWT